MKKLFFLLIATLFTLGSCAQDQQLVDSLESLLKSHNARKLELQQQDPSLYDSTAANILKELSRAYMGSNPDKAMDYAQQCLSLSQQIAYKKGIGDAYNNMGAIVGDKGDYLPALEFYKQALKIRTELGDKRDIAGTTINIGVIYDNQGNYPEAFKNYIASLKMFEEIGSKKGIAVSYGNISGIYQSQGNYPKALSNLFASLKIFEEIGDKKGIAGSCSNIGNIYSIQGNFPEALKNHFAALKINEDIGDKSGIAYCYNNIGTIYSEQGNFQEALKNHFAALKINEEIGDKNGIANSYINIGQSYTKEKKYNDAYQYLNKGLTLAKEIGSLENINSSYMVLAGLDSMQGNFSNALEHYKLFITYRDSLVNSENSKKTLQMQMNYDFGKKQDSLNAVQNKKDLLATNEKQKQQRLRNIFMVGFAVMLLLAAVFLRQRNRTTREKKHSDDLLLNILPDEVATELKATGTTQAKAFTMVTVMFTDFKDFTTISEKVSAELLVAEIHHCFSAFDRILQKYKIEKIKTIGDSYMCASGLPVTNYTHAKDMVNAAFEIRNFMLERKKEKEANDEIPFELRIGIHTGPVVAGIVGIKKFAYDIWGDTVNLAARMEQNSEAGKINISGSTYELVKDKFNCVHRGKIQAKNKGEIDMYFVEIKS